MLHFQNSKFAAFQIACTFVIFPIILAGFTNNPQGYEYKLTGFAITVSIEQDDEVNLECNKNCSWQELSFSYPEKEAPQIVNQDGITKYSEDIKDDSVFIFEIYLDDENIYLSCRKGCAWKRLSFEIPPEGSAQNINYYGMDGMSTNE